MDTPDKLYINFPYDLEMKVTNSHKHLAKALYTLVSQRSFDLITVKDICEEANVSRSNFYNHFDDKYHLLLFYLNQTLDELRRKLDFSEDEMLMEGFLSYIHDHGEFFSSLVAFENGSDLRRLLESAIKEDLEQFLWTQSTLTTPQSPAPSELQVIFLTGGITSIAQWWILNDFQLSVHEIALAINDFVSP